MTALYRHFDAAIDARRFATPRTLTDPMRADIFALWADAILNQTEIAERFSVDHATVCRIVRHDYIGEAAFQVRRPYWRRGRRVEAAA